jgi:hypothetical protein
MLTPDEVSAIVPLRRLGWGSKRIAAELGCGRYTVKRYTYRPPQRKRRLDFGWRIGWRSASGSIAAIAM